MARSATLVVKIISDAKGAATGFKDTETAAARLERRVGRASKVASVGLLAVGAAALASGRAAAEDERSQILLASALRKNANASKGSIAATERWIDAQARAKGIADDELRPALATLVRATGSVGRSQKILATAMDVAASTGKPLETVTQALAKGYGGQFTALQRLLPGIDQTILKSGDMDRIMGELSRTMGGDAARAADTASGKLARMQVAAGELNESLGAVMLPVFSTLAMVMAPIAKLAQEHTRSFQILVGIFAALAVVTIGVNAAVKAYTATTLLIRGATIAWRNAQLALNLAMMTNPLGLIIVAIAAVAAGMVLAYKKSATFRAIVQAVGRAGQVALQWIVSKARDVAQWFGKLGPAASKAKSIAVKAFEAYTAPLRALINLIKDVVGWIGKIKFPKPPGWLKKAGGLLGLGGAPVVRTGMGPRAVRSPVTGRGAGGGSSFLEFMAGSRGAMQVNIRVDGAIDPVAVADQIATILRRRDLRRGVAA